MPECSYRYSVYGLNVDSSVPLPEVRSGAGTPDVMIRYGILPTLQQGAVRNGSFYQAISGSLLLFVDGVAQYLITYGKRT